MNLRNHVLTLAALAAALCCIARGAPPPEPPSANQPVLAVVVVDALRSGHHSYDDSYDVYNRIAEDFGDIFEKHHWPVRVTFEQFAANNDPHALELRIFYHGVHDEFGERRFRAWVTFEDHGTKHDFGMVTYRYMPRPAEPVDDVLHKVFRGEAEVIAGLLQPYLVPTSAAPKP